MTSKRMMWSKPWGYAEGWIIVAGLLVISYLWQGLMGSIPVGYFAHPVSTIIILLLVSGTIYIGVKSRNRQKASAFIKFIVSPYATITSLSAFFVQILIMGFSTQVDPRMADGLGGLFHSSGWSAMVHSYPFNLLYIYILLILGSISVRRLISFRLEAKEIGFMLNHFGLYGFLLFALISGGTMKRYTMPLIQNEVEWRGINQYSQQQEELPIALELKHFTLDEYPPKLMLLDGKSGQTLPEGLPDMVSIEEVPSTGRLMDWDIKIEEYLPLGAPLVRDSTVVFSQFATMGGAPAVRVSADNGQEHHEGWVSCGSFLFPYRALSLGDELSVVMPYPDVRQYYSTVNYYLKDGQQGEKVISVNDPLKVGDWYVYQLNFDEEKRRWAESTEVELVYDPWIKPVMASIWVLFVGAIFLLLGPANAPTVKRSKESQ